MLDFLFRDNRDNVMTIERGHYSTYRLAPRRLTFTTRIEVNINGQEIILNPADARRMAEHLEGLAAEIEGEVPTP